jgi:hypothetical protein
VPGSHEDAMLIVELSKWGAMIGLPEASMAIFGEDFDPDNLGENGVHVRTMLTFGETVATLVKNDLLDRELVYDWFWFAGVWDRVGAAAKRSREMAGAPNLYESFEALASESSQANL